MSSRSRAICSQSKKNREICDIPVFLIVRVRVFRQMLQLQFMIEKRGSTVKQYTRDSAISQSLAISSQRPKCANLAPAETNAYETSVVNPGV